MSDLSKKTRHMLIAGTGRAGTSFLVEYLSAVGLNTHISMHGMEQWFKGANAGFEDLPLVRKGSDLPYVIKTPWAGNFIDQLLASDEIEFDVVLIPIRDLRDAASSRLILEMQSIYESSNWMTNFDETWSEWGFTPGGGVFSLDPVDMERLLGAKFAKLVQRLVAADILMVFLDFPRIIHDADYLYRKLRPHLPPELTLAAALLAHETIARQDAVRVSNERLSGSSEKQSSAEGADAARTAAAADEIARADSARQKAFAEIDLIALRREITKTKETLAELHEKESACRRAINERRFLRRAKRFIERLTKRVVGARSGATG